MMQTKSMPEYNIRVGYTAFLLGVVHQTIALSSILVDVLARWVSFLSVVRRNPQLLESPRHALSRKGVGINKDLDRVGGTDVYSPKLW